VQGFVDKNTNSVAMLHAAIGAVAQGRVWFSDAFLKAKAARLRDPRSFDKILTQRERDVLALVGLPMSDAEISADLHIAIETVEKHRFNILRKLDLQSTTELVRYARDHGFTLTARPGEGGTLLP
jgi:two-component system response regulator NreC